MSSVFKQLKKRSQQVLEKELGLDQEDMSSDSENSEDK